MKPRRYGKLLYGMTVCLLAQAMPLVTFPARGDVLFSTFGAGGEYDPLTGVNIAGPAAPVPQGFAERFRPTVSAFLDSAEIAVSSQFGNAQLSVRLYSDNAGAPGELLEQAQVDGFTNGIVSAGFDGNRAIDAGSDYWLGVFTSNDNELIWHDTTAVLSGQQALSGDDGLSWSTFSSDPFPRAAVRVVGTSVFRPDVSFIATGSAWRYLRGVAEPSAGLEWTAAAFDDTLWDFDVEGFGYDTDPATQTGLLSYVGKELADMRDDGVNPEAYTSLYLRRTFDVTDPAQFSELVLELDYDDSFIAYVNGIEVARSSFGSIGQPEPFDGLGVDHESTNGDPNRPLERFVIDLVRDFPSLLQAGDQNVLAVHGLNAALDDTDFVLSRIGLGGNLFAGAVLGDLDCDGDTDFDDIDDFVLGLTDPAAYQALYGVPSSLKGDADGDGDQDFDDIPAFVDLLAGGNQLAVPEPSVGVLVLVTSLVLASRAVCGRR